MPRLPYSFYQSHAFGVRHLPFPWLHDLVAESVRRPLADGEQRRGGTNGNDVFIPELVLQCGHPLLHAFCTRMQANTNLPFEECVSYLSQLFAYGTAYNNCTRPLQFLQPGRGRMRVPGVQQAAEAVKDVFNEQYIGHLYQEEIQAAANAENKHQNFGSIGMF